MSIRRISVFCGACFFIFYAHLLRSEENLSFGKTTTQSSTYRPSWNADRAVDGCLNQDISSNCCIHTPLTKKEVWWQVDLGSLNTINYITIYYRDGFERRFAGYQLYLSNTTDWTQGNLCYEDTSKTLAEVELIVTHQCPYVARYVVVYNYRSYPKRHERYDDFAVLELCEVQVFGCPIQKHGYGNCNKNCSHNCYGGNCNGVTGSCFYCLPGKWGDACDQDCPTTCKTNTCIPNNGSCTECKPGRHGDVCDKYCPVTCNGTCDKVSSYCRDCVFGQWGDKCDQECALKCKGCIQTNGSCIDCNPGRYGQTCDLYCPTNCANDVCDRETGSCFDCKPGKHGETCDLDCSVLCEGLFCEKDTGFCSECKDGMHGYRCDKPCPASCSSNRCRRYDGTCGETNTATDSTYTDNRTTVAVLAAITCIFLVAAIVLFVCMLRFRTKAKRGQGKEEEHYTNIDQAKRNVPNTYEMTQQRDDKN